MKNSKRSFLELLISGDEFTVLEFMKENVRGFGGFLIIW